MLFCIVSVQYMNQATIMKAELSNEERNLLSVAYKNVIGAKRSAWRVISSVEQKAEENRLALIKDYREVIEGELNVLCDEVLVSVGAAVHLPACGDPSICASTNSIIHMYVWMLQTA